MSRVNPKLERKVWQRAAGRCEYCGMPASESAMTFEIEHIIPRKHAGQTAFSNLCLACFPCNRYKGTDVAGFDPKTKKLTRFFHPRLDIWVEHFVARRGSIVGRTDVGRTTANILQFNKPDHVVTRRILEKLGRWTTPS